MTTVSAVEKVEKKKKKEPAGYKDRPWFPRFWDGMTVMGWFRQTIRNRFAIHPVRLPMFVIISLVSLLNSALAALQALFFSRRIRDTAISEDPIFIIGHWRSGTTMLHELLVLDPRHTCPSTYQCFAPNHFLISGWFLPRMLSFIMPDRRPMDNMAAGWDRPQEDEFALCNMDVCSPYLTILFPNRPPQYQEYLDLARVPPGALAHWKKRFLWFLKCVTLQRPKRIVLKSPPHTCRIPVLLDLFPHARFVHIVRDPYVLYPSTVNLWKRLYQDQSLQVPRCEHLGEEVFQTLNHMYAAFEQQRGLIPAGHLCEVRYEDLVDDTIGQMRMVYEQLGLGEFEQTLPALEAYVADHANYKTNRYEISPETRAEIARRWAAYFEKYAYQP